MHTKRRPMIVANWKMNKNLVEARELIEQLTSSVHCNPECEIVLCPPFPFLLEVSRLLDNSLIKTGAQNMHPERAGAFTGEVSPCMLSDFCEYVILGHSERRSLFGETNKFINKKVLSALDNGLKPILCVGETEQERAYSNAAEIVGTQVKTGLADVTDITSITIAYEPRWAIGTGRVPKLDAIKEIIAQGIRKVLQESYPEAYMAPNVLYGGSVTPENVLEFCSDKLIDGVLVGGASLTCDTFTQIISLTLESTRHG